MTSRATMPPATAVKGEKRLEEEQACEPLAAILDPHPPHPEDSSKSERQTNLPNRSPHRTVCESSVPTIQGTPSSGPRGIGLAASYWAPASTSIATSTVALQALKPDIAAIATPVGPSPRPTGAGLGASRWAPTGNSSMGKMDVTKHGE